MMNYQYIYCNCMYLISSIHRTQSTDAARMMFKFARANLRRHAIVHLEAAKFEMAHGMLMLKTKSNARFVKCQWQNFTYMYMYIWKSWVLTKIKLINNAF